MKRGMRGIQVQRIFCLVVVSLFLALVASAVPASALSFHYSGSLSDPTGITGTGDWYSTLSWDVSKAEGDNFVLYSYTFTHVPHDASYIIFEVSSDILDSEIWDATGVLAQEQIRTFSDDGSNNQHMPSPLYGVKFDLDTNIDNGDGTLTSVITFKSDRLPTWGDFYARCGIDPKSYGGADWDTAWNLGFGNPDSDPSDPPSDGSVLNHILVPDSQVVVPEPASLLLIGSGLICLIGLRKKFK